MEGEVGALGRRGEGGAVGEVAALGRGAELGDPVGGAVAAGQRPDRVAVRDQATDQPPAHKTRPAGDECGCHDPYLAPWGKSFALVGALGDHPGMGFLEANGLAYRSGVAGHERRDYAQALKPRWSRFDLRQGHGLYFHWHLEQSFPA